LITQRFRRQIRDQEFEFRFAHHGEEALATLSAEPDIDLMLLDINMPVMDGLTLLHELRERQLDVQAIIVSAYGDMTNLRTAMNRGAFDFVTKPVDLRDLEITVRKAMANVAKLREMDRQRMAAERARNNLSRYFAPNIVELLAAQDEPLGAWKRSLCCLRTLSRSRKWRSLWLPDVLAMLREFHTRMTAQIFGGAVDQLMSGSPP
jgi:adenylate cyclase